MKIPAILLILIFSIIPAGIIIVVSLYETNLMSYEYVGIGNYIKMWPKFSQAMVNTFWYLLMVPVAGLVMSTVISLTMADKPKRFQDFARGGMYVPVFSAGVIIASFWKWFFSQGGIANWIVGHKVAWLKDYGVPAIGFIIVTTSMGAQIMLLSIAIKHINTDQYEAAIVDGASWLQIKLRIILPQILPTISVILLFSIVGAMQIWETIYMIAPYDNTASMMYRVFADGFMFGKYGIAAAECVVMLVAILIVGFIREKIVAEK